jgi:hypothetical protein
MDLVGSNWEDTKQVYVHNDVNIVILLRMNTRKEGLTSSMEILFWTTKSRSDYQENFEPFMEPEGSLMNSQGPVIGLDPEPV